MTALDNKLLLAVYHQGMIEVINGASNAIMMKLCKRSWCETQIAESQWSWHPFTKLLVMSLLSFWIIVTVKQFNRINSIYWVSRKLVSRYLTIVSMILPYDGLMEFGLKLFRSINYSFHKYRYRLRISVHVWRKSLHVKNK